MPTNHYRAPRKSVDCPHGITLNVMQKLRRGKDLRQAQVCTVGLLLI